LEPRAVACDLANETFFDGAVGVERIAEILIDLDVDGVVVGVELFDVGIVAVF